MRQERETPQRIENGRFYVFDRKGFMHHKCRWFGNIGHYLMRWLDSSQVDHPADVEQAERILQSRFA